MQVGIKLGEGDGEYGIETHQTHQIKEALNFFTGVWTQTYTSVYTCMFWTESMLLGSCRTKFS